jgi:simple sugar transport system permease protein
MKLILERRDDRPAWLALASPLAAVILTLVAGALLFITIGKNPMAALKVFFLDPLSDGWALQELGVKATPLILIAVGLTLCYRANVWNIGAEGQLVMGAIFGSWLALATHGAPDGRWVLVAMLALGALGGMAWALIPALLKARLGVNEILTSLMLVYVAELTLDYLVRGRWRDPKGFNFPQSVNFEPEATIPLLFEAGRLHIGFLIAVIVALAAALILGRTLKGFEIRLAGEAPRAARFAGFDDKRTVVFVFAVSGALAGLAGIIEVAGPIGQLQPSISPGYGFTAIIVAFLGRLNPIGALVAALFLALTFIGGENAQIALRIPLDVTRVFQGLLLFFVLGCDTFLLYRLRLVSSARAA